MKEIPNDYCITILDRLLRLEPAYIRYKRVFCDIINKFCKPNISAKNLNDDEIIDIASDILKRNFGKCINYDIQDLFIELENMTFKNKTAFEDKLSKKYLKADVNYISILNRIPSIDEHYKNVLWLKECLNHKDIISLRQEKSLLYPIEKVILVEGQTEFILLKTILKLFDFDFDKFGIFVYPTDGKNRSARKYYELIEYFKLPIFVLLDKDAYQIKELIEPKLRNQDKIYILNSGEFEDIIPNNILKDAINSYYKNGFHTTLDDFNNSNKNVENLELIYKKYGYGDFKKAKFAMILKDYIENNSTRSDFNQSEIVQILTKLKDL